VRFQYKHTVAIVYTIVLFLDRLDLTIINVALPTIANYFGVAIIATDWISMAFLLALSVSIPISSWLGDRFGLKKIYISAVILFGLTSSLCACATNFNSLIFLRFLQGIGGGLLIPVGMTMLYRIYDKAEYASITSFTFIPSLIAPSIAPFLGGILLDCFGWRYIFLLSGPICLVLAVFALIVLKEDPHRSIIPFDWIGFLLSASLLVDIFFTLSLISRNGLYDGVFIGITIFLILIICFIWWERRISHPLIDLSFFNSNIFVRANLIQLCFQACHFGAIFLVSIYLQVAIGMSASITGLIMGMQAVGAMTTSRYSVRLFNKYGPKVPIIVGLAGVAILSPCIMIIQHPNMITFGIVLFFIRGIFSGLCGSPIQTLSIIDFSKEKIGQVNSIFNACRQVAISLGIAISSILISIGLEMNGLVDIEDINQNQVFNVFILGFWSIPIIAIIGILITKNIEKPKMRAYLN